LLLGARAYVFEDIGRIGALGLTFVELNLHGMKEGWLVHAEGLEEEMDRWGLKCLIHGPNEGDPCDIPRLSGRFYENILGLIDACKRFSAPLLTVHFWQDGRFIPERILERKREILCRMAREADIRGVQVCLENLSERPEDLQPMLEACPELGITLDMGHGQLLTDRNRALAIIERWPERIKHVHAHDNRGGDHVEDDLHLPIGEGLIDFPMIFQALKGVGYAGTVTVEVSLEHLALSVERIQQMVDDPEP
jgi:sugar phosphate isomerase/epimerase